MMKIAAGFNIHWTTGDLPLPDGVDLIELGLNEILEFHSTVQGKNLSLHLARTPITEHRSLQKEFIRKIAGAVDGRPLSSVGVHLIGDRRTDIGRYGFSSHYFPSSEREERAVSFLRELQDRFQIPVWLENANFYSESAAGALRAYESAQRIADLSGARLIVDLSHIVIDATNVGLDPAWILGAIDWKTVVQIHLSGMVRGRDGAWHDGHGESVPENTWTLLGQLRKLGCLASCRFLNLEHTDVCWREKSDLYREEFAKLEAFLSDGSRVDFELHQKGETYARSYLKTTLIRWIPGLEQMAKADFENWFSMWIDDIRQNGRALVINPKEVGLGDFEFAPESFIQFIENKGLA